MQAHPRRAVRLATALAGAGFCAAAAAQPVPPPPRLAPAPASTAAAPAAPKAVTASAFDRAASAAAPRAAPNVRVIEDEEVRIEEARGPRGQLQRVTVLVKGAGGSSYEIIVPPGGKDASQARGAAGQRAWSVFDF